MTKKTITKSVKRHKMEQIFNIFFSFSVRRMPKNTKQSSRNQQESIEKLTRFIQQCKYSTFLKQPVENTTQYHEGDTSISTQRSKRNCIDKKKERKSAEIHKLEQTSANRRSQRKKTAIFESVSVSLQNLRHS